jgi:hypothetical protein
VAQYDDLIKHAEQLGVPANCGVYKPSLQITDYELYRRIREDERHIREHQLWIVAVISAVIAVPTAIAGVCKDIWASLTRGNLGVHEVNSAAD